MRLTRLLALASLPALFGAAKPRLSETTLSVTVQSLKGDRIPILVIASAGQVTSNGKTYPAKSDTLHVTTPAELTTTAPTLLATFIGDSAHFLRATVKLDGEAQQSGSGAKITVTRSLQGSRLQATSLP